MAFIGFRSGRGWLFAMVCLVAVLPTNTVTVWATDIAGNTTTIPYYYTDSIENKERAYLALYEFMDFSATNLGTPKLDLYLSGWGRGDVLDKVDLENNTIGDAHLDAAYLRWRDEENIFDISLGRRLVATGPVMEHLDGLQVRLEPLSGLGLQAFGGIPVFTDVGERDGDWGYGGRIFGGWRPFFEIGVSGAGFTEKGDPDRAVFGGDLSVTPVAYLDLFGHGYYDFLYSSLYDANATLLVRPATDLKLLAQYERLMPSAFLGMGSIFSVFSFETIGKINTEARYIVLRRVTLSAAYNHLVYDSATSGNRYGGAVGVLWGKDRESTVNVGVYDLERADNGYLELRGYFYQDIVKKAFVALDAAYYQLDQEIYGVGQGFNGTGSVGWHVLPGLDLSAAAIYLSSPYYDYDLRGLLKVSYSFDKRNL